MKLRGLSSYLNKMMLLLLDYNIVLKTVRLKLAIDMLLYDG
jgi:hypothetical protein